MRNAIVLLSLFASSPAFACDLCAKGGGGFGLGAAAYLASVAVGWWILRTSWNDPKGLKALGRVAGGFLLAAGLVGSLCAIACHASTRHHGAGMKCPHHDPAEPGPAG